MTVSDTGCSSGAGIVELSARRYYTVAGHYCNSSQPEAITESSASWIQSDPT